MPWSRAWSSIRRLRFLPEDVLNGLHLAAPCLVFPDPAGPGRRASLKAMLGDHPAVVGPTVAVTRAALSLRLARRGLDLLPPALLAYFECGFNASSTAARLHTHPQTVRNRLRLLEPLFGPELYDPASALDHLMALHAWQLLTERPAAVAGRRTPNT